MERNLPPDRPCTFTPSVIMSIPPVRLSRAIIQAATNNIPVNRICGSTLSGVTEVESNQRPINQRNRPKPLLNHSKQITSQFSSVMMKTSLPFPDGSPFWQFQPNRCRYANIFVPSPSNPQSRFKPHTFLFLFIFF